MSVSSRPTAVSLVLRELGKQRQVAPHRKGYAALETRHGARSPACSLPCPRHVPEDERDLKGSLGCEGRVTTDVI